MSAAFLTPNEIAELSGAPKTIIEKAIEHHVLRALPMGKRKRGSRRRTQLPCYAVGYASIVNELGRRLTIADKKRVAKAMASVPSSRIGELSVELAPGLTFRTGQSIGDSVMRAEKYAEERDRHIEINDAVMGGTPVIRGTRITVYAVQGRLDGGDPVADLLADYPGIPPEAFEAARIYARTHPLVGRPGGRPWARKQAA